MMWPELYTMQMTYRGIVEGERPWNALGDFMNYWFGYTADRREDLIKDPIQEPVEVTLELRRWAAFCAAAAEYLCARSNIPCPGWVHNPVYTLSEPWFKGLGAHKPHVQQRLIQETPGPFARRNIYCGDRVFANKYELATELRQR
ncbi:MAG: hypothetical protein J2P36_27135, partial [Ktedonobacteraceae bacterium]|nr:hypothetical protein [Ktedonobacteraceae bacterium]